MPKDATSEAGLSRRAPVSVSIVLIPAAKGRPERKQDGGEPGYEPDWDEDEDDEEAPGSPEEEDNKRITIEAAKALRGQSKNPDEAIGEFLEVFGREQLQELRRFVEEEESRPEAMAAGGRLVEGPGRGMDDRISARAGSQPVLLSDGEFVVPADVVSHLGDGSTKAGVRALEGMMARARKARTGTAKQAAKLDHKRVLPV